MLRRWWRSTGGLVALVALCFAVATVAIGAAAYVVTHEALEVQLDHRVAAESSSLLAEARRADVKSVADVIRRRSSSRSTASLEYMLTDDRGNRIAGTIAADVPAEPGYVELLAYRRGNHVGIAQSLVTKIDGGTLIVGADRGDLDEIDAKLAKLYAGALAAMLAVGVFSAGVVGAVTRRRLDRIDAAAHAIIGGDLSRRVVRDGSDSEFDRLAATLNRMLDRIGSLMDNLRQVSSDVAHDLRTPLTRLQNHLEAASSTRDEGERDAAMGAARLQAGELLELFAALLRIAEVEGLAERRSPTRLEVGSLLAEMADTYRPDFEATGHLLKLDVKDSGQIEGDRRLLAQAIANLLDNALRHTPPGTLVTIGAAVSDGAVEIVVVDDGPGVDPEIGSRIFQRFVRSEGSRSSPGHGLGLSLVLAVATAHGGTASLVRGVQGFGVRLLLPKPT